MFFHHDYETPGPGVDPDAPEKTGSARLWQILELEIVSLVKLNLLFLVSCLPIITIPPALLAMNTVVRSMVLDQPGDRMAQYRAAFKKGWRTGYAAFAVTAVPIILGGCGAWYYLRWAGDQPLFYLPFLLCSTVLLIALLSSSYLYGLVGEGRTVRESLRGALVLGIGRPLRGFLGALWGLGLTGAAVLFLPLSILYLAMIGLSLPCLMSQFFVRTELKRWAVE
jgi:hypothetical protein